MQTVSTTSYELTIPSPFDSIRVIWESVRAEYPAGDDFIMISVGLNENKYYEKFKGNDLEEKFHNCCLERRGQTELLARGTLDVNGRTGFVCQARSDTGYFFYFALLPIDDNHSIDFIGDCPYGQQDIYIPLFEQSFLTVCIMGDVKEAMANQKAALASLLGPDEQEEDKHEPQGVPIEPVAFEIPANGQEFFRVDGHAFAYLDTSEIHIPAYSNTGNELTVNLKARVVGYDENQCAHILNDYDDGEVYFTFSLQGVYRHGVPTGKVRYEKERDSTGHVMWKGGFKYDLELYGELTLTDGWLGFDGYFQDIMETKRYTVSLAKRLSVDTLAWKHYRFGSLEEIRTAPAGIPRHLQLHDFDGDLKGYQFIAQLNCKALAPYQPYLPRKGVLYFFITDQEDFGAKVIYYPGDPAALRSASTLDIAEDDIYDDHGIYTPYRAEAAKYVSIPYFYSDDHLYTGSAEKLAELEEDDEATEELRRVFEQATERQPTHSINSYVFKQHDSPQIEAANKLMGRPEDFVVLLRVSSDNQTGFSFWDAGEIYFVIHKSDLAKGDFSNVFCGLESS